MIINIYCDESAHLEHDESSVMGIGAVWVPLQKAHEAFVRIREIKEKHGVNPRFEVKWTKVSPGQIAMYLDLVDYFFDDDDLHFRGLIVPDKRLLSHERFGQSHDDWYYKMYFSMLKTILSPDDEHRIYLDIKDTQGNEKVRKLHLCLSNSMYDFSQKVVNRIQLVRSEEIELLQLVDLLLGAVVYTKRELVTSSAKLTLINRIRERSGYDLRKTTLIGERKFNLFFWKAQSELR